MPIVGLSGGAPLPKGGRGFVRRENEAGRRVDRFGRSWRSEDMSPDHLGPN
jgi:hypothetical protein